MESRSRILLLPVCRYCRLEESLLHHKCSGRTTRNLRARSDWKYYNSVALALYTGLSAKILSKELHQLRPSNIHMIISIDMGQSVNHQQFHVSILALLGLCHVILTLRFAAVLVKGLINSSLGAIMSLWSNASKCTTLPAKFELCILRHPSSKFSCYQRALLRCSSSWHTVLILLFQVCANGAQGADE